jgi:hypothetical protein
LKWQINNQSFVKKSRQINCNSGALKEIHTIWEVFLHPVHINAKYYQLSDFNVHFPLTELQNTNIQMSAINCIKDELVRWASNLTRNDGWIPNCKWLCIILSISSMLHTYELLITFFFWTLVYNVPYFPLSLLLSSTREPYE